MWTVVADGAEFSVRDHNGDEQARLSADGGISTSDVKGAMHERAATLKSQIRQNSDRKPVPVGDIMEWMQIIEDMAGEKIKLPGGDT